MVNPKVSVIQVASDLDPRLGGPSRTIVQLCDAMSCLEQVDVTLLSQPRSREQVVSHSKLVRRIVPATSNSLSLKLGLSARSLFVERAHAEIPMIIHDNGLWSAVNHQASSFARKLSIPMIIQTHGMLSPWALSHHAWKKRIAMALYQRHDLDSAKVFVATSMAEYENIREFGIRQPVAVIPNGVEINDVDKKSSIPLAENRMRTVLFLGRIHPVKGLFNLVEAWGSFNLKGWRLCIAGPDESGYLSEVMSLARKLGVESSIEYVGEIDGAEKSALFRSSDLFVLPSFSENFGVVVAESLTYGLPVITTKGTPWEDLERYDCGWWVDVGVSPLALALKNATSLSDEKRNVMGSRGREYVQRYEWSCIAEQMVSVYRWTIGVSEKPDCILID